MKGLHVDPRSRFASAHEMAEALARLVPPALPTEIGEWVRQVAKESLERRAALLAEIESDSVSREDGGTEVSGVAQGTPAETGGSRFRSVRVGLALAVVLVVVAVAGTATLMRRMDRQTPNQMPPSPEVATAPAATSADPAPSAPVAPSASPTAATSAPPSQPSRPSSKAGRASAPATPSAARNCNPNFYYDSAGQMRFKPECFH